MNDQLINNKGSGNRALGIVSAIEKFYKNSKGSIVSNAAQGWSHAASIDKPFIEKNLKNSSKVKISEVKETVIPCSIVSEEPSRNARQLLDWLNNEEETVEKFKKLKTLIECGDLNLINDSFFNKNDIDISIAQQKTFSSNGINIVIIGAGITGLFLASTLKNTLGKNVNILVLENRSDKEHSRKPFNREWLTHIESHIFQRHTPPFIKELFECFGMDGFVGLPLNMLEAILMLSCKDQGVKFYFSPMLEYSRLNNKNIGFFFDATGRRFAGSEYSNTSPDKIDIELPERIMGGASTDINSHKHISVTLKKIRGISFSLCWECKN